MTMVQVQKKRQCQLKVNIMSNRKKVMLTKRSGSVVERLTRDRGAAGSSLTVVTVLCP